jgi:ATP/ADP translocase
MANDLPPIQSSQRFRVPVITTKNLSVVISGLVLVVALLKAKPEDIPKIVEMLVASHLFCMIGWIFAFVILLGSVVFIKLLIRSNDRAISRLSKERDDLQTRLFKLLTK